MELKSVDELLNMSYLDIVNYLKLKYGNVPGNYFNDSGNKNNKITRGNEGLYIHHIDEDKMILLSNKLGDHPVINSGRLTDEEIYLIEKEFQKKERLVYCDLLEHLLLHLKIVEEPKPMTSFILVGIGGVVNFLVPELNDIYSGIKYKQKWKNEVINKIINRKEEYFKLLKYGIEVLNIDKKELTTTYDFNYAIWNINNNLNLFKEFDNYLQNSKMF